MHSTLIQPACREDSCPHLHPIIRQNAAPPGNDNLHLLVFVTPFMSFMLAVSIVRVLGDSHIALEAVLLLLLIPLLDQLVDPRVHVDQRNHLRVWISALRCRV